MTKDNGKMELDKVNNRLNLQAEDRLASDTMSGDNTSKDLENSNINIGMSDIATKVEQPNMTNNKKLKTNEQKNGGNFVPLLKNDGVTCPPLQYRPRSTGAIYGSGYDAETVFDNTRSLKVKKEKVTKDGLEEVDFKKPKPLWLKVTMIVLTCIFIISGSLGVYYIYLDSGFKRLYNMKYIEVLNEKKSYVVRAQTYEVVTYNLNYGMFGQDYTYYKSYGFNSNGGVTNGSKTRAKSKEMAEINIKGSAGLMSTGSNANVEFFMFQEIDVDSTRSFYVDERQILKDVLSNYAEVFAETGGSKYVFYPITSPVGRFNSGMATYSAFDIEHAIRYSLPSNNKFLSKYTATDNCAVVVKLGVSGVGEDRQLVLININVSQHDDEETRRKDLEVLYQIMAEEVVEHGNYVIVGGSYSYLLYGSDGVFENKMKTPSWCGELPNSFNETRLNEIGCRIAKDEIAVELKTGTIRDSSVVYSEGDTFEAITDGFIVSNNIIIEKVEVLDNDYLYSSHNPVRLTFKLK